MQRLWFKPNLSATATSEVTQHLLEAGLRHGRLARLARLPHLILQAENRAQVYGANLINQF